MGSTFSTSLRLELQGSGENAGTWGTKANNNFGNLLEQAITGVGALTHPNTVDMTLTASDAAPDQARNAVLVITGTLTVARNVVVPAVPKVYIFKNSTTGGFDLTLKTPSGSGVTVSPTNTALVFCDGTNVVLAIGDLDAGDFFPKSAEASTADFLADVADKVLTTDQVNAAGAFLALTDAATIAWNMALGLNAEVTLGANRTLGNPTNPIVGRSGALIIRQDATGNRALLLSPNWKVPANISTVLSTAPNAYDILSYFTETATRIVVTGILRNPS